jgi:hypothetical protein
VIRASILNIGYNRILSREKSDEPNIFSALKHPWDRKGLVRHWSELRLSLPPDSASEVSNDCFWQGCVFSGKCYNTYTSGDDGLIESGHSVFVDHYADSVMDGFSWRPAFCLSKRSYPNPWGIYSGLSTGDSPMRLEILVQRLVFCNAGARRHTNTR